jgi:hydrogenase maturation protein HypF
MQGASSIRVRRVVQGVGFRPFVYHLAREYGLHGWVFNCEEKVSIHVEGSRESTMAFVEALQTQPPPAAVISEVEVREVSRRRG